MRMIRSIKLQVKRSIMGKMLPVAVSIAILHALSAYGFMRESDVWYTVYNSMSTGITFFTIYLLPTMVFSASVAEEIDNHAVRFWTIRSGIVEYTVSKIIAASIAGFLAVFLGIALYIGLLDLFLPIYKWQSSTSPYEVMIEAGAAGKGLLLFTIDVALSGAVTACFGMVCSFFILSRYTAVGAPMMLYLTLSRFTDSLNLPEYLNAAFWMHQVDVAPSAEAAVMKKLMVSFSVIIILGSLGVFRMYRRFQND